MAQEREVVNVTRSSIKSQAELDAEAVRVNESDGEVVIEKSDDRDLYDFSVFDRYWCGNDGRIHTSCRNSRSAINFNSR